MKKVIYILSLTVIVMIAALNASLFRKKVYENPSGGTLLTNKVDPQAGSYYQGYRTESNVVSGLITNTVSVDIGSITTNQPFTVHLYTAENFGNWSTNGGAMWYQFTTAGTTVFITGSVTLQYFNRNVNSNCSATNSVIYTINTNVLTNTNLITNTVAVDVDTMTTNQPFTVHLYVAENFGVWSTNGGAAWYQFTTAGATVPINGSVTLLYFSRNATSNCSVTNSVVYTIDTVAPVVTLTLGASNNVYASAQVTEYLSVNENSGFWSTNGGTWNSFDTNGVDVAINRCTTLQYYARDGVGNTSATNSRYYGILYVTNRFVMPPENSPSVEVSWPQISNANTFYIDKLVGVTWSNMITVGTSPYISSEVPYTGLTNWYRVRLYVGGYGVATNSNYIITQPTTVSNLTATAVSGNSITVSWGSSKSASIYYVYVTNTNTGAVSNASVTGSTSTTLTKLTCKETPYSFIVLASNATGPSLYSSPLHTNTFGRPDAPSPVYPTYGSPNYINWNLVPGADFYNIIQSNKTTGVVSTCYSALDGTNTRFQYVDFPNYSYGVVASNSYGGSTTNWQ
ncbi:MAG: fibronectin type III domain-containing protein [Spirochaetes bacterium]|nr:fibronectin type III domain-containing protein [Spirochaetota bacterium]